MYTCVGLHAQQILANIHDYFKTSLNTMGERRGKGGHS